MISSGYSISAGLRARWGVREHIFSASGMITPIDNRGISLEWKRKRERDRRSVGGRTPDNAVPPDTHPSRTVCNYPRPGEIIYECKKERGRESGHYTYARELRHSYKVLYLRWRRSLWSSLRGGESHKSRGGSLPLLRSLPITLAVETLHCNHRLALFSCFEDIRILPQFLGKFSVLRTILYYSFNYARKINH